ncbi:hypothetical protein BX666DRAFT_670795 [Dichotomocladium elegans]|nr:hypothetical protein BX666DRAFT_670795 [Dichotomocladium elegans]
MDASSTLQMERFWSTTLIQECCCRKCHLPMKKITKGKTSFDHHKAMFGLLASLRTIASLYKYASFDSFEQLKIHFIHTHSK